MSLAVGDVVEISGTGSGASLAKSHLHFIVKLALAKGDIYCILFSLERANWDSTCEIVVADSVPGVTRTCFIAYLHAKKVALRSAIANIGSGLYKHKVSCPPPVCKRVLKGVLASDKTEKWFADAIHPPPQKRILSASG